MRTPNVTKLILTFLILFGCTNQDETELIEPEQNVLYQYYPEFKTDENLQNNEQMLHLLEYLANNPEIFGITELNKLHVATSPVDLTSPNGRTTEQNELWEILMNDSTVVIKDMIIPSSFFSGSSEINGRTTTDDNDCISTTTGLKLPASLCDCETNNCGTSDTNGGGSSSSGNASNSSTIGFSYGSPSSVESFFNPPRYGGGISSGNNTSGGDATLTNMLIFPSSIEQTLTQDPDFYDKLAGEDQLSISEAMYWTGWGNRLDEIENQNLYYDILQTKEDYAYLYQFGREMHDMFEDLLRNPLNNGILNSGDRAELISLRKQGIQSLKGQYIISIYLPVAEAAKPWIELALIETGIGATFNIIKGILSVKWGVQLAKIGLNTSSISTITKRMVNGLEFFGINNRSLNLTIGGRNLTGSAYISKKVYSFSNVSAIEAEAVFADIAAGREIKTIVAPKGIIKQVDLGGKEYIQFRKWSTTNAGEVTIEFKINSIGTKNIELKFFP